METLPTGHNRSIRKKGIVGLQYKMRFQSGRSYRRSHNTINLSIDRSIALEIAYNSIAVEPISIKHEKDLIGKATWEFDKPAEVIFRQQPSDEPKPSEDPINQLKMRFIKGEISEEEYRAKLRVLQER